MTKANDIAYEVGQKIQIGHYVGYKQKSLIKTQAKILRIEKPLYYIRIYLSAGGTRTLFGTKFDLRRLQKNYNL